MNLKRELIAWGKAALAMAVVPVIFLLGYGVAYIAAEPKVMGIYLAIAAIAVLIAARYLIFNE
jgi:cobalamin biosynthesis protein CobD/CbiB